MSEPSFHDRSRNDIILEYYPLVRGIAYRLVRRIPASVDAEEFVNIGVLGLIDAIERFDPDRGVPFKSYAEIRIRGAIMDSLRADDWIPRSVRRKASRIERTARKLRLELDRKPTEDELAQELGMSDEEFRKLRSEAEILRVLSIHTPIGHDSDATIEDQVPLDEPDVEERWVQEDLKREVVSAIKYLPKRERTVVTLYYLHGLTLREIGEVLDFSESRACQVRSQAVRRLKTRLQPSDS